MAFYGRRRKKGEKRKPRKKPEYNGIKMESKSEVNFAKTCDQQGIKWKYEPTKTKWAPPVKVYKVDFKIERANGTAFYVEYKGYLRTEDRTKMSAMKLQHPEIDIRFVFADASKPVEGAQKRKDGTKQSNGEWATKNGYLWSEGFIKPEWMEED